ncbi:SusC/RagA family TonB-linked outer membrane protein [Halpernia frigidisoli]|uniref:Iron complex outermembrane recepter protein n=1 Tax=Halpernia frigidisoli TaxID=1125876 RepID=A0A1I3H1V4_9FLAO|nr:SusC/RagA family TonB-linked outer membrane protein [Halpernia frigidisoli]SFI29517.1 iron complex outermembrane recepter protein [Halpernia frigidisoli]
MKFKTINTVLIAAAFFTFDFAYSQQTQNDTISNGNKEKDIQEVVLIGYGGIKKSDATGSVTSVKAEDFNKGTVTSPEQLLQGKAAGVQITSTSGDPNAKSNVRIRGFGSIRSGGDPLYVIDGVPISSGDSSSGRGDIGFGSGAASNPLNFINPNDIESIDVLKDAGAVAIYGSRGANGVIIITTKKGKKGAGQLTFNATSGFSRLANRIDLLGATEYAAIPGAKVFGSNTDALKEITRTGTNNQYDLSYAGGSDNGSYRVSLAYLDQKGILLNSGQQKTNISYYVDQKFFDNKLKLESSFTANFIRAITPPTAETAGAEGDVIISALRWNPTRNLFDPTNPSGYTIIADNPRNPLNLINYYTDISKTYRTVGNVAATLTIAKGLDFRVNYGVDYSTSQRAIAGSDLINIQSISTVGGTALLFNINKYNYVIENTLNYKWKITDKFNLNAIGGYSFQQFDNAGQQNLVQNYGGNHDQNYYIRNIFAGTVINPSSQFSFDNPTDKLQSYFGRAIFDYNGIYVLNAIMRADGSSKFGANNKYGYFPSISGAWNIDKEGFAPDYFNTLKLRGGFGITGNQDFPSGLSSTFLQPNRGNYRPVNFGNADLKWEQTEQYNAGIDFGLMQNRISGSLDFYNKTSKDVLVQKIQLQRETESPLGFVNLDNTRFINKGAEFSISYKAIKTADFNLDFGGNVAYNITKATGVIADGFDNTVGIKTGIINGQGLTDEYAQGHFDGQELFTFNLLQFRGFDANGLSLYDDANGGVTSDPGLAVKKFSGSALPKYNVGLFLKGNYKNLDFTLNGYGQYGGKIYDNTANALFYKAAFAQGTNVPADVANSNEAANNSNGASTRFLSSSDFFRFSNMSIGYTLKGESGIFNYVKSVRFNITGQNLFVITGYKGFDPEVSTSKPIDGVPSYGIDYASYPKARTFSAGVNINF